MKLRHYLQWHILHRCNLRCRHCYQENYEAEMPFGEMLSALDRYEAYVRDHDYEGQINLTGGEPLLHPDFFRIAGEIRRREIRLGVLTNGTLITEETARELAALAPVFVQVSLDGPREIHDGIRGPGNYDRAMAGIDRLKRENVRVLVSFTAMKGNYRSFGRLARECGRHRVDKLWWDRVVTGDGALFLSTEEFKSISREAFRLKRRYPFISNDRALQWLPGGSCGYACSAGKRLLVLLADGTLMPCRRLPFTIGNIRDAETLAEAVDGNETMKELARPIFPGKCIRCGHIVRCGAGARCVTYAQTGRLDACDVNCWIQGRD